jgi:DNA polymerase beta
MCFLCYLIYGLFVVKGKEAQQLDGIGKKIAAKIDEILESGKLEKLDHELEDENTVAINEIAQVTGIGPAAARKFVFEDGIKSLDDLRKNFSKLNKHQQIGLKYFEEFNERIPRAEVAQIEV